MIIHKLLPVLPDARPAPSMVLFVRPNRLFTPLACPAAWWPGISHHSGMALWPARGHADRLAATASGGSRLTGTRSAPDRGNIAALGGVRTSILYRGA